MSTPPTCRPSGRCLGVAALALVVAVALPARAAELSRDCQVVVFLDAFDTTSAGISHLVYELRYPTSSVEVVGSGGNVACVGCVEGATDSFADDDAGAVVATFESSAGTVIAQIAACRVRAEEGVGPASLSIIVREASEPDGTAAAPEVFVAGLACDDDPPPQCTVPVSTTTTTQPPATTTTTTTTTVAGATTTTTVPDPEPVVCGDADGSGTVTASDALAILRAALGLRACEPIRCDTDGDGAIKTNDGLRVLRVAVGIAEPLDCPSA